MMRNTFGIVLALLATFTLSTGCATGKGAGRLVADAVLPPRQEVELGKQMSAEVEQEMKVLDNPAITAWIKGIGTKIGMAARKDIPKGIQLTFKVIDDDATVNAFAIPGGTIYIYTGLLKTAENEAEVAAVIGHEISHVTRRHIAKQMTAMYGLSALSSVALGNNPGLLAELVSNVAANGYLLKHSRDAEREADKYGMSYMVAAGYAPVGYVTFFTKLARSPSPPAIISTHPNPRERVKNARERLARYNSKVRGRDVGKAQYQKQIAALK